MFGDTALWVQRWYGPNGAVRWKWACSSSLLVEVVRGSTWTRPGAIQLNMFRPRFTNNAYEITIGKTTNLTSVWGTPDAKDAVVAQYNKFKDTKSPTWQEGEFVLVCERSGERGSLLRSTSHINLAHEIPKLAQCRLQTLPCEITIFFVWQLLQYAMSGRLFPRWKNIWTPRNPAFQYPAAFQVPPDSGLAETWANS